MAADPDPFQGQPFRRYYILPKTMQLERQEELNDERKEQKRLAKQMAEQMSQKS